MFGDETGEGLFCYAMHDCREEHHVSTLFAEKESYADHFASRSCEHPHIVVFRIKLSRCLVSKSSSRVEHPRTVVPKPFFRVERLVVVTRRSSSRMERPLIVESLLLRNKAVA